MPLHTPLAKVSGTAAWGARVILHGTTVEEAAAHARHLAATEGLVFIHPYDDPAIMAGQGTLAVEMFADAPLLDALLVPIGGGGLIAGCAVARPPRRARPPSPPRSSSAPGCCRPALRPPGTTPRPARSAPCSRRRSPRSPG